MRRVSVGDFRDVAEAGAFEMVKQRPEVSATRFVNRGRSAFVDPRPRIDERTEKPRPDGALMVRAVALTDAAAIRADVSRFERA